MASALFADTWYFVATIDPTDEHHEAAVRLRELVRGHRVTTHDAVLTELLAFFSADGARYRALASRAVREARLSLSVVPADRALFSRALALYEARPDKAYSHVDCMSMTVMRDQGITQVLTNDHHFQQEGFTVLSDLP
jgi:predicted nucleic acid-binding protein